MHAITTPDTCAVYCVAAILLQVCSSLTRVGSLNLQLLECAMLADAQGGSRTPSTISVAAWLQARTTIKRKARGRNVLFPNLLSDGDMHIQAHSGNHKAIAQ